MGALGLVVGRRAARFVEQTRRLDTCGEGPLVASVVVQRRRSATMARAHFHRRTAAALPPGISRVLSGHRRRAKDAALFQSIRGNFAAAASVCESGALAWLELSTD